MRQGLDGATQALYTSGVFDLHWKFFVENGSGTQVQITSRTKSVSLNQPDPEEPIGSLALTFVRENTKEDLLTSLAPTVAASSYNKLDDGITYSPLLQLGRLVYAHVALTAQGAARPVDGSALWYEVFRGYIAGVSYPTYDSREGSIRCNGMAGILQHQKSETAYTYLAGTSLEAVARAVLDNNGFSSVLLDFPVATGKVLPNDYAPGLQKTVWEQLWAIAQSMGWVAFYRYTANNPPELTFFAPEREKVVPDMAITNWWDFEQLEIDESEVRNVGYVYYYDEVGAYRYVGPEVDVASLLKYGGSQQIRRPFWIGLNEDSPIRSEADAQALLEAALSDVADPDAIATVDTFPLVFAEVSVDLYTFAHKARFFDSDQTFAPYRISITASNHLNARSKVQVRGLPTAGSGTWRRLNTGTVTPSQFFEEDRVTLDLEQVYRDQNQVTWRIRWGANVSHAYLWLRTVKDGTQLTEPADDDVSFTDVLFPEDDEFLEVDVPITPEVTWITIRPFLIEGTAKGLGKHFPLYPTDAPADRVISFVPQVVSDTGAVLLPVIADTRVQSVVIAYNVAPRGTVLEPTVEQAEDPTGFGLTGRLVMPITGSDTFGLAAGTVGYNEEIVALIIGYVGEDGLGPNGRRDEHGEEVISSAIREMPSVSLAPTTNDDTDPEEGLFGATLHDPGGFVLEVVGQTKTGSEDWSAEVVLSSSPTDGFEYLLVVPKERGHQSSARITARGVDAAGAAFEVHAEVGGFDYGLQPNVFALIPDLNEDGRTGTATVLLDPDTLGGGARVMASLSPINDATALAAPLFTPPGTQLHLFPTDIGTLISGLNPGDLVYFSAVAKDRNDVYGDIVRVQAQYGVVAATLDPTDAEEDRVTALATFEVTVRDTFAQADALYYQKRVGGATWPTAWTLKTAAPADGVAYSETVAIAANGHSSQIRFRLDQTIKGKSRPVTIESPAFDWGSSSRISIAPQVDQVTGEATSLIAYNFDTDEVYIKAKVNSVPTLTEVRAETPISTPVGTASVQTGTLVTATAAGDIVHFRALGKDAAGDESPDVEAAIEFQATASPELASFNSVEFFNSPEDNAGDLRCPVQWTVANAPYPAYEIIAFVYVDGVSEGFVGGIDTGSSPENVDIAGIGAASVGLPCFVRLVIERQSDGIYVSTMDTPTQTVQP